MPFQLNYNIRIPVKCGTDTITYQTSYHTIYRNQLTRLTSDTVQGVVSIVLS